VRHGANVNAIFIFSSYHETQPMGCYWKTVVESGNVAWAAELLDKYRANVDWPF